MMYEYTQYNLLSLMQNVGTLERNQIIKFFSSEMAESRIRKLLDKLVLANYLKYDPIKDRYSYHAAPKLKDNIVKNRIIAFWPVANLGSNEIMQIYTLDYPFSYMIITPDNIPYDITVCYTIDEARFARDMWARYAMKSSDNSTVYKDDVNHMAVVFDPTLGEKLKDYGFDMYCMINDKKETIYKSFY